MKFSITSAAVRNNFLMVNDRVFCGVKLNFLLLSVTLVRDYLKLRSLGGWRGFAKN